MEKHHPKDVSHKKPWKEYLLEFLLLFLAVFLSFLADNFREERVDRHKAVQYIKGLYNDLTLDTARLQQFIAYDSEKLEALSRLNECFDGKTFHEKNRPAMLAIIRRSTLMRPFSITTRSLDQLAVTGSYRMVRQEEADSIISYMNKFEDLRDFQSTIFQSNQDKIRARMSEVLSFKASSQMFDTEQGWTVENFPDSAVTAPLFQTHNPALLNSYFNELMFYYRLVSAHRQRLYNLLEAQEKLLAYLGRTYQLKGRQEIIED